MARTQQLGNHAEHQALSYLEQQGLTLLQRNYRWKGGEIDLIMQDQNSLVFVEVRYRSNPYFADALASIGYHKQQRLIRTAQRYLQRNYRSGLACRFDVIGIDAQQHCTWIKNAFNAE
jgi:putative endonuclease